MALRWLAIAGLVLVSHQCELPPRPTPEPDPPVDLLAEAEENWQALGLEDYEVTVTQTTAGVRRAQCSWVTEVRGTVLYSRSPSWSWDDTDCGDWDVSVPDLHRYISDRQDEVAAHGGTLDVDWAASGVPNTIEFDLDGSKGEERSLQIRIQDLTGIDTARTMRAALADAQTRWAEAGIASYELVVDEKQGGLAGPCTWTTTIIDGEVTATSAESSTSSLFCDENEVTVEQLHRGISGRLDMLDEFSPPPFGEHVLNVAFNDVGVPEQLTYDLAVIMDEESSLVVTFTPMP